MNVPGLHRQYAKRRVLLSICYERNARRIGLNGPSRVVASRKEETPESSTDPCQSNLLRYLFASDGGVP